MEWVTTETRVSVVAVASLPKKSYWYCTRQISSCVDAYVWSTKMGVEADREVTEAAGELFSA
jgi:hypothetical protein